MNIDKRWFLLLVAAVSAALGAAVALKARRRHHRTAHELEYKKELKSWENEGGNVAPTPAAPVMP